ncbi:MAG: DUF2500 domain-containing protein [Clostridia bacterium]|nr:DUF2500 domain-containing protein [Clostridia bacterium]
MNDTYMFETVAIVIAALPIAIILITTFVKVFKFIRNLFSDKKDYPATVIAKKQTSEYHNNRVSKNISYPYRLDVYFVTFTTPKHKKLNLKVDANDFRAVKEGDTGVLTLQGSRYISFEKKPAAEWELD